MTTTPLHALLHSSTKPERRVHRALGHVHGHSNLLPQALMSSLGRTCECHTSVYVCVSLCIMRTQMYTCVQRCAQMCTCVYVEYTQVYAEYDVTPINRNVWPSIGTQDFEDQSVSSSFYFLRRLVLSSLFLSKEGFPDLLWDCFALWVWFGLVKQAALFTRNGRECVHSHGTYGRVFHNEIVSGENIMQTQQLPQTWAEKFQLSLQSMARACNMRLESFHFISDGGGSGTALITCAIHSHYQDEETKFVFFMNGLGDHFYITLHVSGSFEFTGSVTFRSKNGEDDETILNSWPVYLAELATWDQTGDNLRDAVKCLVPPCGFRLYGVAQNKEVKNG